MNWISVIDDEKPEEGNEVIGWDLACDQAVFVLFNDGKFENTDPIGYGYENRSITHWMPLPARPEKNVQPEFDFVQEL